MLKQRAPLISICIPAYNRPQWLRRALTSILTTPSFQHPQIEVIVSDDSTIADCQHVTHELLTSWQGPHRYQQNFPSLGMAANWNRCIQMALGKYVLLLHDDDYLEVGALSKILQTLQKQPDAPAILFGVNVVTSSQHIRKQQIFKSLQSLTPEVALEKVLTNSSFIRFPGIVLAKKIFHEIGYFDETIGGVADLDLWVRVCHKYGLLCVPAITANYTVHDGALTMTMFNSQTLRELEKIFNQINNQHWLSTTVLQKCKTDYFHQFILAGTVRYLRSLEISKAKVVFNLFYHINLQHSQPSLKWKIIKAFLSLMLIG